MSFYDPWDHASEETRNDWAVRSELYARRRLAELDHIDSSEVVRKMLERVEIGPQVCCRPKCAKVGARLLRLTGDWVCRDHDPLADCGVTDPEASSWECNGWKGHPWGHRFRPTLERVS